MDKEKLESAIKSHIDEVFYFIDRLKKHILSLYDKKENKKEIEINLYVMNTLLVTNQELFDIALHFYPERKEAMQQFDRFIKMFHEKSQHEKSDIRQQDIQNDCIQ